MDVYVLFGLGALMVVLNVRGLFEGYKNKRIRYTLKSQINTMRPMVTMIWSAYALILSLIPLPAINEFSDKARLLQVDALRYFLVSILSAVYVCTVVGLIAWAMMKSGEPILSYNEQELIWKQEEKAKNREILAKIQRKLVWWK